MSFVISLCLILQMCTDSISKNLHEHLNEAYRFPKNYETKNIYTYCDY